MKEGKCRSMPEGQSSLWQLRVSFFQSIILVDKIVLPSSSYFEVCNPKKCDLIWKKSH